MVQCALIPTYTESYEVLHATVAALAAQNYPEHLRVCAIITRETDTGGIENVDAAARGVRRIVSAFLHIKDPLLPGIVVGQVGRDGVRRPGAQGGVRRARVSIPSRTMVTDLDSDFRLHPQYFAYITLQFCTAEDRLVSIWQPVPVFLNNIWRVPTAVRVMATAATQWQMFLHQNPHRLVMFSSYTMSLDLLADVGYWDSDVIPEDSRFFWKALLPHRRQAQHEARLPARVRRRTARARLRGDARLAVQPDQALGVGSDRYPLRHLTNAESPGDPAGACARGATRTSSSTT